MGRAFAVSDIHGNWNVWQKIKAFLQPDDTLYILGDCADRGERGWDIIKEAINHPQTIYLKGNHEDMLAKAIKQSQEEDWNCYALQLLRINGGDSTYQSWQADGAWVEWATELNKLPTTTIYKNTQGQTILLSHAGYTPFYLLYQPEESKLLWDRDHFFDEWPEDLYLANTYIVHGHTPILHLANELNIDKEDYAEPFWYCDNHKCCIDNWTIMSNSAILLDLDTFEFFIIE